MTANPLGWSTTSASNTTIEGVDISEGMSPAGVNNGMRATMTGVKELANILTGAATSGGAADVQTLTSGMSLSAYAAGQAFVFEAGYTNTGAMTLNVDSIGAKAVVRNDGSALAAGDITAGGFYFVGYEAGTGDFHLLNPGIGGYLANLSEDTSPTLGGHLAGGGFDITKLGTLSMTEQAAANADVAGDGQLWIKTATPNELWFTDDAGTDFQVATLAGTETLTNKTFDLTDNTLAGTLAELSSAISDATVASTAGSETLTNKTLTSPVLNTGVSGTAVLDEDTMSSDSATQLATQQSIKAYVDAATDNGLTQATSQQLTTDADNVTFTGLAGYDLIEVHFVLEFLSTANLQVAGRTSAGTWREWDFTNITTSSNFDLLTGKITISNFGIANEHKIVTVTAGSKGTGIDASNATIVVSATTMAEHGYTSYQEIWDELRIAPNTGDIEGSTADSRGLVTVYGSPK